MLWIVLPSRAQISWNFTEVSLCSNEIKSTLENKSFIYLLHKNLSYMIRMILTNQIGGFFDH